ncbi:MAG TPA: SDR family NAD(P)-dependent oxidoreductase [Gaiellaceae bacterium]|nr:SDR family NAD(P)-dependent oxidoreductase [Gaiellaceae bacterium]
MTAIADLLDLTGGVAIVTGGANGIGRGISRRLAEAGASVVVADLDTDTSEELTADLTQAGYAAHPVAADVTQEEQVAAVFRYAADKLGGVDILVNNAGIFPAAPLRELTPELFDRVLAVNLRGLFLCTKYAAEAMIEQGRGGRIVNVTSIDALHPSMVGLAHYDASKHGAWGFTKNVALELAPYGITVNAIAPGGIETPGVAELTAAGGGDMQGAMRAFEQMIPLGRMGVPDDIGKVALFLASGLADYVTGAQIVVDGGRLLA